jgi:Glycosyltransferase family 87
VDFSHSFTAATLLHKGGNPYSHPSLVRAERSLLLQQKIQKVPTQNEVGVLAGHPPIFYSALIPLTVLPYRWAALLWILAMYAASGIGFWLILAYFGWTRRLLPLVVFLALPRVILGVYYGNIIGLVFLGAGCSLALSRRHPAAAGLVMALAWAKPQVALPITLMMAVFHVLRRTQFILGFVAGTTFLMVGTIATSGPESLLWWVRGLFRFSDNLGIQPNLASVGSLFAGAPTSVRLVVDAASLAVAMGLTIWWRWKLRDKREVPILASGWLWAVWLLATPYAHFSDEMLLAAPVVALLGHNAWRVNKAHSVVVLYVTLLSLLLFSWSPVGANLLPLALLPILISFILASRDPAYSAETDRLHVPAEAIANRREARSLVREPDASASLPATVEQAGTLRAGMTFAPLAILLILWLWLFFGSGALATGPNGRSFGVDFAQFFTASRMLSSHHNPYDYRALIPADRSLLRHEGIDLLPSTTNRGVRVGNPPLFFWLLGPLTNFRLQSVAIAWILTLYAFAAVAALAVLWYLRWRRPLAAVLCFLAMPQVVLGVYYGNVSAIVLAFAAGALCLAKRHPATAGLIMSVLWLKPPIGLPIVLLVILFHAVRRGRAVVGFVSGTAILGALTVMTTGTQSLAWWFAALTGYSKDIALQPNLVSLSALYVGAPALERMTLQVLCIGVAVLLTLRVWWTVRDQEGIALQTVAWLWGVWFLVSPYAHFSDELVLAIPILAVFGISSGRVTSWVPALLAYLLFFSLAFFSWSPIGVNISCLVLALVCIFLWRAARLTPGAPSERRIITAREGMAI